MESQLQHGSAVALVPMHQVAQARDSDDDWTGLTNSAERRKRQNRLNVRAHRKRKALEAQKAKADSLGPDYWQQQADFYAPRGDDIRSYHDGLKNNSYVPCDKRYSSDYDNIFMHMNMVMFPLTRDHLIPLIHYNALRATVTNIKILRLYSLLDPCVPEEAAANMPLFPTPPVVPDSLQPTWLQRNVPHADWIDILPSPIMRDNAILEGPELADSGMCKDIVGWGNPMLGNEPIGMVAWSDPWDPSGWEMTQGFVRKWGFVVKGCDDLIRATNHWRALRGEDPLVIEV